MSIFNLDPGLVIDLLNQINIESKENPITRIQKKLSTAHEKQQEFNSNVILGTMPKYGVSGEIGQIAGLGVPLNQTHNRRMIAELKRLDPNLETFEKTFYENTLSSKLRLANFYPELLLKAGKTE